MEAHRDTNCNVWWELERTTKREQVKIWIMAGVKWLKRMMWVPVIKRRYNEWDLVTNRLRGWGRWKALEGPCLLVRVVSGHMSSHTFTFWLTCVSIELAFQARTVNLAFHFSLVITIQDLKEFLRNWSKYFIRFLIHSARRYLLIFSCVSKPILACPWYIVMNKTFACPLWTNTRV